MNILWLSLIVVVVLSAIIIGYLIVLQLRQKHHANFSTLMLDNLYAALNKQTTVVQESLSTLLHHVNTHIVTGSDKTNNLMQTVQQRLAVIDAAQQNITDLSKNMIHLKDIFKDKKTRGIFGETQLTTIIANVFPKDNYAMQHQLSNGYRCDCILFLADKNHIVIDAKFPLENYQKLNDPKLNDVSQNIAKKSFVQDIKKHINDIATKYIVANETIKSALMFIPAESIFAEMHDNFFEVIEYAYKCNVWIVSPTTLMAVLTVILANMRQHKTKDNLDVVQKQLEFLSEDFNRLLIRIDKLTKNVTGAATEADKIQISTKKIVNRFTEIIHLENVE